MAKNILVAEDSVTMQKVFQLTFAAEDFNVTTVGTVEEALSKAPALKPDLIIADLSLPGKTGYDLCDDIKNNRSLAHIPVLLLHGSNSQFDESRAKTVKADGNIAKPFETQQLIDKAVELCKETAKRAPAPAVHAPAAAPKMESLAEPITASAKPSEPIPVMPKIEVPSKPTALAATPPARPEAPHAPGKAPTTPPISPPPRPPFPPLSSAPASKPVTPAPSAPPAAATKAVETEITIEAEPPPPSSHEVFPPFDKIQISAIDPHAQEALMKMSREVLEQVLRQIIPELAEKIIRQEIDRLVEQRRLH